MEDEERRRMALRRVRKLRKMRIHDNPVESNGDYCDPVGQMSQRSQRSRRTLIEDVLPDSEIDS